MNNQLRESLKVYDIKVRTNGSRVLRHGVRTGDYQGIWERQGAGEAGTLSKGSKSSSLFKYHFDGPTRPLRRAMLAIVCAVGTGWTGSHMGLEAEAIETPMFEESLAAMTSLSPAVGIGKIRGPSRY